MTLIRSTWLGKNGQPVVMLTEGPVKQLILVESGQRLEICIALTLAGLGSTAATSNTGELYKNPAKPKSSNRSFLYPQTKIVLRLLFRPSVLR
jgi:hypothetical protein